MHENKHRENGHERGNAPQSQFDYRWGNSVKLQKDRSRAKDLNDTARGPSVQLRFL